MLGKYMESALKRIDGMAGRAKNQANWKSFRSTFAEEGDAAGGLNEFDPITPREALRWWLQKNYEMGWDPAEAEKLLCGEIGSGGGEMGCVATRVNAGPIQMM
jgi:hypothetical protein